MHRYLPVSMTVHDGSFFSFFKSNFEPLTQPTLKLSPKLAFLSAVPINLAHLLSFVLAFDNRRMEGRMDGRYEKQGRRVCLSVIHFPCLFFFFYYFYYYLLLFVNYCLKIFSLFRMPGLFPELYHYLL